MHIAFLKSCWYFDKNTNVYASYSITQLVPYVYGKTHVSAKLLFFPTSPFQFDTVELIDHVFYNAQLTFINVANLK